MICVLLACQVLQISSNNCGKNIILFNFISVILEFVECLFILQCHVSIGIVTKIIKMISLIFISDVNILKY